jgi:glycosyltransferase involved in cell wall biosynthesis
MATISFIVPAYNEAESIGKVITLLKENFASSEIIVVDDASSDNTAAVALSAGPSSILRHDRNRGYGAALKTGFLSASGEFVIMVDADGQYSVEEIRKVVDCLRDQEDLDVVLGERVNRYASGIIRSAGKMLISSIVKSLINEPVRDHNCGLRAFRRERILPFLFLLPDGFSFSTTSYILVYKENFRIARVEVSVDKRASGKSQVTVRSGLDTIVLVLRLMVIFDPLKFFLPAAGYAFFFGLVSIFISLIDSRTLGKNYIFFFLLGTLIFILGLLSEQIMTLRKEIGNMKSRRR